MAGRARKHVHVENPDVLVTEWTFAPGDATGWHRHGYDYVIVPVTDGRVGIVAEDGEETSFEMTAGASYFRKAGVEHDVINRGDGELRFVEIELLGAPG